jgi:large subunit ribosomal protein L21
MYAVIEDSGTQIKVAEGDVIRIDRRETAADAATITFDRVLYIGNEAGPTIGQPYVEGAKVTADILREDRTDRVPVVKFKRRKGYKRMKTHRQQFIEVKVTGIQA